MKTEIGNVILAYNEEGHTIMAVFNPTLKVETNSVILDALKEVEGKEQEVIMKKANVVMATWFNAISDIELADREKYLIEGEVQSCHKYPNGQIRECIIKYFFKPI